MKRGRKSATCNFLPNCKKTAVETRGELRICEFCAAMLRARDRDATRKASAAIASAPVVVPLGAS